MSVISPDEEITVEHLNKLSYMKACIKEGFRRVVLHVVMLFYQIYTE